MTPAGRPGCQFSIELCPGHAPAIFEHEPVPGRHEQYRLVRLPAFEDPFECSPELRELLADLLGRLMTAGYHSPKDRPAEASLYPKGERITLAELQEIVDNIKELYRRLGAA